MAIHVTDLLLTVSLVVGKSKQLATEKAFMRFYIFRRSPEIKIEKKVRLKLENYIIEF